MRTPQSLSADAIRQAALLRRERAEGIAYGLVAVLIWAGYLAYSRAGVQTNGLRPVDFALLRFVPAGLVLLPVLWRYRDLGGLAGVPLSRAFVLALFGGPLFITAATGGYLFAPLAHGAVLQPSMAVMTGLVLAVALLHETLRPAHWIGAAVICVGLVVCSSQGQHEAAHDAWLGDLLFLLAGALWAGFTAGVRKWRIDPLRGTAAVSCVSLCVTLPAYLLFADTARLVSIPGTALAGQFIVQGVFAGAIAIVAYMRAVRLLDASGAALLPALVPAAAVLLGIPIAGEWPTAIQLSGLAIVTTGLIVALEVGRPPGPRRAT